MLANQSFDIKSPKDSENSQGEDLDEEEEENDDFRLTAVLTHCQFPNEWRWKDRQSAPLFDHAHLTDNKRTNDMIERIVRDSWFEDIRKPKLLEATKDVLFRNLPRGAAAVSNEVDWIDLGALLSDIYNNIGLMQFGETNIEVPKFDLQYIEYKTDPELGPLDGPTDEDAPSFKSEIEDDIDEEQDEGKEEDVEDEIGDYHASPSISNIKPKKKKRSVSKKQNCYSNLGKVVNGKKYARYGVVIPEFWREYPRLMRAGIWKSLEMRVNKVPSDKCHIVEDDIKFRAIEEVLLNEGSCKENAVKYGINYSTMQNYAHRAIYVLSKILGDTELPTEVREMLESGVGEKEICDTFHIKRPQSQIRVSFHGSMG